MNIPEIVRQYVLKTQGRMPETQKEIDEYLDLINHSIKYAESVIIKNITGERFMEKFGIKTPEQIKKEGEIKFNQ